ncbi:UTP--glucose-1-phosphate uridylyltransferase GalU [Parasulfuritortus cantonensis]|uniref:UTP--glucose-1-phosphate uridylyltransferase n=1 Tax=Parasulfuritortus cantonensis TaxID=2528202 RepID=A0A4R1BDC2_9PROT|nr:UTP--glucose-1-phosphate uridylyltransferase GalU [Parasulfuritortus cantonensis]TCJ15017.1 UTP--glucose-1-phosphate uridylyltransferase GalU [Parasulfuritortus cantonensis]
MKRVTKAVFPAAGLGTRFLPATKATPKEMLPIVDKPLIQYAAEEAVAAGITDLIFIIGRTKRAISDHFDKAYELEVELETRGKLQALAELRNLLPSYVNCIYIRQAEALGLGHAVLCAEPAVNDEPFAVILADDLIDAEPGVVKQMCDQYDYYQSSIVGVQTVDPSETGSYGIVASDPMSERLSRVTRIVEKPKPENAPSNRAVVGRYILTPRIFQHLRQIERGAGGELQLTDAIQSLLKEQQVLAYAFEGTRYDCGSKFGYLQATVEYAMKHPEVADEFSTYLRERFCGPCKLVQP